MVPLEPGLELVILPEKVYAKPGEGWLVAAAESRPVAAQSVVEKDEVEVVWTLFVESAAFD